MLRLHRHSSHAAVLAAALALASCGGGGSGGSTSVAQPTTANAASTRPVTQSDLDIAQLIYAGTPRTPASFYVEAPPATYKYVSTVHLKNTDVDASLSASAPEHELCTDDWNQAIDWSQASEQQTAQPTDLVSTEDTMRYFEFGRVRSGDPDFYLRERIFKCGYLDRGSADLRAPQGSAGQMNARPLTADELRLLSEYLWQFTEYNNFGHVVLKSSGATASAALSHTLVIASLVHEGVSASCDRIDVVAWKHVADVDTGALTLQIETLMSFGARANGGAVELCTR